VGNFDTTYIQAASLYLTQQVAGARRAVMPGTAHLPNMEQPDVFNHILGEFLAAL
jgi:pimeloyl-ACP methyl ester carboxylesterase